MINKKTRLINKLQPEKCLKVLHLFKITLSSFHTFVEYILDILFLT